MKCPNPDCVGGMLLGYGIEADEPCPSCNGTGEVEDKSRSVQRREALQKGEPMPEFDKPEMPERIWAKDFPEAKQPTGKMGGWVEWSDTTQTEYLRADKVRELVKAFDGAKCLTEEKAKKAEELLHALFPEGVERLTNGEE
jgi:hypothetical protein